MSVVIIITKNCFACVGYVLLCLAKDGGNQFTEKIAHTCSGNWRERIFQVCLVQKSSPVENFKFILISTDNTFEKIVVTNSYNIF